MDHNVKTADGNVNNRISEKGESHSGAYEVYEPAEDSQLLKKHIRDYAHGSVLDMGTGTGILAEEALKYADDVTGTDINEAALSYCRKHIKGARFIKSDLFSNIHGKYDLIIFNPPYLPQDKGISDPALYGGKRGYETILRFLEEAPDYLRDSGTILLLFSERTGRSAVDSAVQLNLLEAKAVDQISVFFEKLFVYEIRKSLLLKRIQGSGASGLSYFAKGRRGIVYKADYGRKKVAVKVKNAGSDAVGRIANEAFWLRRLNKEGIGPKLLKEGGGFIVMELIEGQSLDSLIRDGSRQQVRKVLRSILKQLYIMDCMGCSKGEMHRPSKNLIIRSRTFEPVLIDFERCRKTESPKNLTQFFQFMESRREILSAKGIGLKGLRAFSARYKRSHRVGHSVLEEIFDVCGL